MYILYESSVGFGIFKVIDEDKLKNADNLYEEFETIKKAHRVVQLEQFRKFEDVEEASMASSFLKESKVPKPLKKLLKKMFQEETDAELMVWDPKLGAAIKEKLGIQIVSSGPVNELMRCLKVNADSLIPDFDQEEFKAMTVGVAHNFSRHQLKFSPDKVDTMVVQAINLLDDLDKELNNYIMRAREWYGWHFPELSKIISDHTVYINTVLAMGMKENAATTDFSQILPTALAQQVQQAAEVSMGTEISEEDLINIHYLCQEIKDMTTYRAELSSYLTNRMMQISPNLTSLVGDLVGARLIAHAGSLINLAKYPASTIQILGAEKALFSAIKARKSTPKYGLIYHAHLVGQASKNIKGKAARKVAAKAALAARYDALTEEKVINDELGIDNAAYLKSTLQSLEDGKVRSISGRGKSHQQFGVHERRSVGPQYFSHMDSTMSGKRNFQDSEERTVKKFKVEFDDTSAAVVKPVKSEDRQSSKKKIKNKEPVAEIAEQSDVKSEKKKKKDKQATEEVVEQPKKKKKKDKQTTEEIIDLPKKEKKKKKDKKFAE